ncbi:MAG: sigma-54-dependent Fis family transcriptional regulator [Deltaproteobacteria bacterium]|nr:sigma-54-dependent Fis family transcriptional regulator [Deltaproteobacteria bacterium]
MRIKYFLIYVVFVSYCSLARSFLLDFGFADDKVSIEITKSAPADVSKCSELLVGNKKLIVGQTLDMQSVLSMVKQAAPTDASVIILGDTGTGKELIAYLIHLWSSRSTKPFVAFNCSALADTLVESELFGHARGAFTGAEREKIGLIEAAEGGTLFLDEVGEMSLAMQAKLLRAIETKEIRRVGENKPRKVDFRIVAATNKNLLKLIGEKLFREDLYYRLNVIPINLPSLRERVEDIPALANYFLEIFSLRSDKNIIDISPAAMLKLRAHYWGGNIRELQNTIERAVVLARGQHIEASDLQLNDNELSQRVEVGQWQNALSDWLQAVGAKEDADLPKADALKQDYIQYILSRVKLDMVLAGKILGIRFSRNLKLNSEGTKLDEIKLFFKSFEILSINELPKVEALVYKYVKFIFKKQEGNYTRVAQITGVARGTLYNWAATNLDFVK